MSDSMTKVSQSLQAIASQVDDAIAKVAGERVAFSLFVFTEGRYQYISTADRDEVAAVLAGALENWKLGAPDIPAHNTN